MPASRLQPLLKALAMSRARFLYGLDRVPDDRLPWTPGGEAPTPLQLAGKIGGFLGYLTYLAENRAAPEIPPSPAAPPSTREEAKAGADAAFARLRGVLLELSEEDLAATIPAPWGQTTIGEMLWWLPALVGYFQGQLNLIQMAYGDKDPNIPPNWGQEEI